MSDPRADLPAPIERAVRVRLARFEAEGFLPRLRRRDASLWGTDPALQAVARNRLGWLDCARGLRLQTAALRDFAAAVAAEGYRRAVVLGMGGSSLAAEVLARTTLPRAGALGLEVLDNTSPAAVNAVLGACDPAHTLFVIASKSGGTIEVDAFERSAFERIGRTSGDRAASSFVAITDPGTPLESRARERGYRAVFLNAPDIGGRFSALSLFGLVPAALCGVDLDSLLDAAIAEAEAGGPEQSAAADPGIALGVTLGELALAGRDKITLALSPAFRPLGPWIEQLLAESTGKNGRGLVPIDGEPLAGPDAYGPDRAFVSVALESESAALDAPLAALARAGHPVLRWTRSGLADFGAEFHRWHMATAAAGAVLEVQPFDEPDVTESKRATQGLLERYLGVGSLPPHAPLAQFRGITAVAPVAVSDPLRGRVAAPDDPFAWATALPGLLGAGDYFALLTFFRITPDRAAHLERIRLAVRARTRAATTIGVGPRFLHSTGQLHKGGPDRGVFLQLTASEGERSIPGLAYGFAVLQQAQADGDFEVLIRRGRRILRLDLGPDVSGPLARLADAFEAVAGLHAAPTKAADPTLP